MSEDSTENIDSILESARGDLETEILEHIESEYGLSFLEPNETVHYVGVSLWGVQIKTESINNRVGSTNRSLITDKWIRLIVQRGDEEHNKVKIGYDEIDEVDYNSGLRKDSITLQIRNSLNLFGEKWERPRIKFRLRASKHSGSSVDKIVSYMESKIERTTESRYSKLDNRSSELDYVEIEVSEPDSFDSVDRCAKKYDKLETKIDRWESVESQYSELNRKSNRLDYKEFDIPKPDSFGSIYRCEKKYDELEETVDRWSSGESQHPKLSKKNHRLNHVEFDVPKPDSFDSLDQLERTYRGLATKIERWKSVDHQCSKLKRKNDRLHHTVIDIDIPKPDSFGSIDQCKDKYDKLESKIERWKSAKRQYSKLNQKSKWLDYKSVNIPRPDSFNDVKKCEEKYEELNKKLERWKSVEHQYSKLKRKNNRLDYKEVDILTPDSFNSINQCESKYNQYSELFEISSDLSEVADHLPAEPLTILTSRVQNEGLPEAEELQEWRDILQKVKKISNFMKDADLSHPSVDVDHWQESIEIALEEGYPDILSPIVDQVEKMESGVWELDDLYEISWQEFETLIGSLYESFGYETEVTSDTADMGVDVWATNSDEQVAIQAKRYQDGNRVGRETLQKLASTLAKGDADRVVVVTTSEFTRTAEEYSDSFGSDIELIDGDELRDQLNNSDLPPIN